MAEETQILIIPDTFTSSARYTYYWSRDRDQCWVGWNIFCAGHVGPHAEVSLLLAPATTPGMVLTDAECDLYLVLAVTK